MTINSLFSKSNHQDLATLHDVCVSYGARKVLHNINLTLMPGDFLGLIGPNGAGKSTLMGLFNSLTPYQSGHVIFDGVPVTPKNAKQHRLKIAHVFQIIDIDSKIPISVFETVLAGTYGKLGLFKKPTTAEKSKVIYALEQVGMLHLKDRPLGQLSGGERQKVAIARALAQEPQLLLLDEPTAALDWQAQREILELVQRLQKERQLTVLLTTHDLNAISTMTNKVAMLQNGRLIWVGSVEEAMDSAKLSELYSTPITIYEHGQRKVALF